MGAVQNPALQELNHRLGKARVELQAAKEEDGVVVSRQHIHGAAFKSGRISNGDIICKVDGIPVGECLSARAIACAPLHPPSSPRQGPRFRSEKIHLHSKRDLLNNNCLLNTD